MGIDFMIFEDAESKSEVNFSLKSTILQYYQLHPIKLIKPKLHRNSLHFLAVFETYENNIPITMVNISIRIE